MLVVGGEKLAPTTGGASPPTLADVQLFDPTTNAWSAASPLHHPRQQHTATLLPDGRVLVLGGESVTAGNRADPVSGGEVFDPAKGTWTPITPPPVEAFANPVVLLDGTVLLVGQEVHTPQWTVAERYDPRRDRWTRLGAPPTLALFDTATLLADGRVLYAGGTYPTGELPSPEATVALYNPAQGTWHRGPDLPEPLLGHVAVKLTNGQVLVAGKAVGAPVGFLFDPMSSTWSIGRSPDVARDGAAAATLADGRVLVVGNSGCTTEDDIAELFNPTTGRWSSAGPFPEIDSLTATPLPDGRVLIVEGQSGCLESGPLGNVFLFQPTLVPSPSP